VRAARAAREVADVVIVAGRERAGDWPADLDAVRFVPDEPPGVGPLGGLAAALSAGGGLPVAALACDMPRVDADALRWLLAQASEAPSVHGLVTRNGEQAEPLFAVYHAAVLPLVAAQVAAGRRSLQALLAAGDFAFVDAPREIAARLANVNTPEDLAAALTNPAASGLAAGTH
jgi:molybdopterin-guanine dinucleotide biosynthesis protein A